MHILFLTDNFPPEVNAPASRTFEHCREWVRSGHQVTVMTCAPNFPQGKVYAGYRNALWQSERIDGIRVIRVWTYITANQGLIKRILDYLSFMLMAIVMSPFVRGVDLVIGTSPQFFTACAAYVVSRCKRIPFVFELRDLWPESIVAVGAIRNKLVIGLLEKVEMFLYRKAACIVSVTHSFTLNLIARGIDPRKIGVVTNGVDISRFRPQPKDAALVRQLNLDGQFVAGYIGTHGMAHGLETILDAADRLRREGEGRTIRFILLGDGACKAALQDKARAMGLENVLFIDSVPKEEVVRYWSLLDVSIIHLKKTDLFTQVIPSKLFECMGMGIPVLHGVAGESAEIVEREGVGLVFEPENVAQLVEQVRAMRAETVAYQQMRTRCLRAARDYDRSALALRMLNMLGGLPGVRSSAPAGAPAGPAGAPMRVLFVNRYFYPDISGSSQLLTELAEDLVARGADVTVVTGNTAYFDETARFPATDRYKGVRVVRVGFTRFDRSTIAGRLADYALFYVTAFWATIRLGRQDCLVVLSDPPLMSILAVLVRICTRTSTISWLQDIYPDIAVRAGVIPEGWFARTLRRVMMRSLNTMDMNVVLGRCMERHLLRDGLSKDRVVAIPNWADGEQIQPVDRRSNEFLKMHGLDGRFVVMYSGNFGVVHDIETIMSVVRQTRDLPNLRYCFVGEGVHKQRLVDAAAREQWSHTVFLPYQPKESLQHSLSAGDLHLVSLREDMAGLCVPSKSYGIMAAGRPMLFIGPDECEAAAVIRESRCGFVIPPGDSRAAADAIRTCYHDCALCERQGQAAREYFVRHAHRPQATAQFWSVLNKVAA